MAGSLPGVAFALAALASGQGSGGTALPRGFLPEGEGTVRVSAAGGPVALDLDAEPAWDDGAYEVRAAPRLRLRFERDAARGGSTLVALDLGRAGEPPLQVAVEAAFPGWEGAVPARFEPRGSEDVAFLALGDAGGDAAAGWIDLVSGRGIDVGGACGSLRVSCARREAPPARVARVEGRIPRGREAVVFSLRRVEPSGPARGPRRAARAGIEALASSLSGWSLPGGSDLVAEARRIAAAGLAAHGAYLEVGDGWQGKSRGSFARPVRRWLAALEPQGDDGRSKVSLQLQDLRALGFRPGLWIVPLGLDDEAAFAARPAAFVTEKLRLEASGPEEPPAKASKKQPRAVPGGFLGPHVVDATSREGLAYLQELSAKLRAQGAQVFRVGGLREALDFYRRERANLADPSREPIDVLRAAVEALREGAGEDVVLAGDWDTPPELAGLLDAARPSLDEADGVEPLRQEATAAARGYHRHRGAWWAEPFPLVGWTSEGAPPQEVEAERSRVLFAALTGRGLVAQGRSVPERARELLRAAGPPAPVRPLDLFPHEAIPRVWDLKLGRAGTGGDLVGVFNFSSFETASVSLEARDLGFPEGARLLLFDVLAEAIAGAGPLRREVLVLPGRARLLAVCEDLGRPQVVAVSGRFLATALALEGVRWDERRLELTGAALPAAAGGGELRVHIACPAGYAVAGASAEGATVQFRVAGGHLVLSLGEAKADRVPFRVQLTVAERPGPAPRPAPPSELRAALDEAERAPLLTWRAPPEGLEWWRRVEGFAVLRDGAQVARVTDAAFLDREADPRAAHEYSVAALPGGEPSPPVKLEPVAPGDAWVDGWTFEGFAQARGLPARRRSAAGGPLSVGGKRFERGIGVRAPSRIELRLDGRHARFEARAGVDDAARFQGSVDFVVLADGAERWRSGIVRGGTEEPRSVSVPIAGARRLSLVVEDSGDGAEGDLADWCDARVVVE
ncbi:MAG: NPCBM/NEW2 domain-containing protein [Planctomycetes bacterium]|nr:NPCBM/NEW2 domain-containing protein [Planctomycetota bacterium]